MSKLQEIKDESLHDGKGVIVHIEHFNWLIEQAEKVAQYEKYFEENSVEAIEKKLEPYYEEISKLYEEDLD